MLSRVHALAAITVSAILGSGYVVLQKLVIRRQLLLSSPTLYGLTLKNRTPDGLWDNIIPGHSHTHNHHLKTILFWNQFSGHSWDYGFGLGHEPFMIHKCAEDKCKTTKNRKQFKVADAVIFHMGPPDVPEMVSWLPIRAHPKQIYIFYLLEPPTVDLPRDLRDFKDVFNLTITYLHSNNTDIWAPLGAIEKYQHSYTPPGDEMLLGKTKMAAWVVSNCEAVSHRREYAKELQRYIPLDIYGKCGSLKCPPGDDCFKMIQTRYKFYLAFENSFCKDYITEKVYRTLQYDVIPVVLGGANYSSHLPPHSYIDVLDFESPKKLAEYLWYLSRNPDEYIKYFEWKGQYISQTTFYTRPVAFCNLCQILHNINYKYKSGFDVYRYWHGEGRCVKGTALKKRLGIF